MDAALKSEFITTVVGRWLDDERFELDEALVYYSETLGHCVTVPKGFRTDFASVPRWPIAYWIFADHARAASVIHDYLLVTRPMCSRRHADAIFHEAMCASGVAPWRRNAMWAAVRSFGYLKTLSPERRFAMKLLASFVLLCALAFVSGCATLLNDPVVKNDMASTVANLKQAAKLGYIAENDPALVCALAIEAKATVDASFAPQIDGVISLGSVAYIAKRVAEKGIQLPMECDAVIGRVVIDGARTVRRTVIPGLLR